MTQTQLTSPTAATMFFCLCAVFSLYSADTDSDIPGMLKNAGNVESISVSDSGEIVSFRTADAKRIIGSLYYPDSLEDSCFYPGVLLFHMWLRNRFEWSPLVGLLQQAGFIVLSIDLRGHGDSFNNLKESKHGEFLPEMDKDARAAYDFLRKAERVDSTNIAAIGASIGTTVSVLLCNEIRKARNYPPLKSMVLFSPAINYFGVFIDFKLWRCKQTPTLFILATNDPREGEHQLYRSGKYLFKRFRGEKEKCVYDGSGHGTSLLEVPGNKENVVDWLNQHMK